MTISRLPILGFMLFPAMAGALELDLASRCPSPGKGHVATRDTLYSSNGEQEVGKQVFYNCSYQDSTELLSVRYEVPGRPGAPFQYFLDLFGHYWGGNEPNFEIAATQWPDSLVEAWIPERVVLRPLRYFLVHQMSVSPDIVIFAKRGAMLLGTDSTGPETFSFHSDSILVRAVYTWSDGGVDTLINKGVRTWYTVDGVQAPSRRALRAPAGPGRDALGRERLRPGVGDARSGTGSGCLVSSPPTLSGRMRPIRCLGAP